MTWSLGTSPTGWPRRRATSSGDDAVERSAAGTPQTWHEAMIRRIH